MKWGCIFSLGEGQRLILSCSCITFILWRGDNEDLDWCQSPESQQKFKVLFSCLFALSPQPPRACEDYWSEFRHCKSLKNCFHHYYTYGTVPSCQQWKEDYHNCREWEKHRGTEAKVEQQEIKFLNGWPLWSPPGCINTLTVSVLQEALRRSEKIRVAEQRNFIPVWQLRQEPPRDWHVPLNQEKPQDSWTSSFDNMLCFS